MLKLISYITLASNAVLERVLYSLFLIRGLICHYIGKVIDY